MKKKVCIIFTVILCVICATAYYFGTEKKNCSEPNNKINKFVRVEQYDRNVYKYDFYNVKGEKIYEEKNLHSEPIIKQLNTGIIKIIIPAGAGVNQVRYYDYKTEKISDIFNTPWDERENKIIRFEKNRAIIQNMFEKKTYQEIKLDIKDVVDPNLVVKEAKFIENNKVKIVYTSQDKNEEKTRIVKIRVKADGESSITSGLLDS